MVDHIFIIFIIKIANVVMGQNYISDNIQDKTVCVVFCT